MEKTYAPTIELTLGINLNQAKTGSKMVVFKNKVFAVVELPMTGTTIIADGGTTVPVKESKEQVLAMLYPAINEQTTTPTTGEGKEEYGTK